jgi:hypothetical protein
MLLLLAAVATAWVVAVGGSGAALFCHVHDNQNSCISQPLSPLPVAIVRTDSYGLSASLSLRI